LQEWVAVIIVSVGLLVLAAGVGFFFFREKSQAKPRRSEPPAALLPSADAPVPPAPQRAWRPIPDALREFRFVRPAELEPEKINRLKATLRSVPRPPAALHKLISADFLSSATSAELSDIVMGEPEVAVKVLAVANSPLYGLQQLVGNIDQAVKFLGVNTVRGICLQYLLNDSIQAGSPEIKKVFERLWNESALACELCFKLAQLLKLDEPGTFVTQIVLVCLGRQATYSLMDPADVLGIASRGLLERSGFEQQRLGLASSEIGALLMDDWGLPKNIINIVKEIDATLVAPVAETSTSRRTRNALCYLCCRVAEELASGALADLGTLDIASQNGVEYFHLQAYLELPSLARVADWIRSPEVTLSINRMSQTMRVAQPG
jgi:HD-like signal output (HDOD) protein